jgi:hypothetical protein
VDVGRRCEDSLGGSLVDWDPGADGLFPTATVVRMTSSQPPAQPPAQSAAQPPAPGSGTDAGTGSRRSALGGWLEGPGATGIGSGQDGQEYRGQRLGLPESGSGSLAPQGRRLGALIVDWAIAYFLAAAFGWRPSSAQGQWGTIAIFAAEHLALLSLLGFTLGKRLFGLRVGRLGGPLTPVNVIVRTVLLLLVIPAVVWDRDGRGLHDRLAGTVEVIK